jgi:hypothetical protein
MRRKFIMKEANDLALRPLANMEAMYAATEFGLYA